MWHQLIPPCSKVHISFQLGKRTCDDFERNRFDIDNLEKKKKNTTSGYNIRVIIITCEGANSDDKLYSNCGLSQPTFQACHLLCVRRGAENAISVEGVVGRIPLLVKAYILSDLVVSVEFGSLSAIFSVINAN